MSNDFEEIMSSIVVAEDDSNVGVSVQRFCLSGEVWAATVVDAVRENYHTMTGRDVITQDHLLALAGTKVTLLQAIDGVMGHVAIIARQGTLFVGSRGPAIRPKGAQKTGYSLGQANVLDMEIGYNKTEILRDRVTTVRAHFPQTEKLRQSDFDALPSRSNTCSLAVFATAPMPDGKIFGALYLCHSYIRGDGADIVENVMICPPGPWYSEHGSMYGKDLLRIGGKVVGFEPISFKEALDMCDRPYGEVLDFILAKEDA